MNMDEYELFSLDDAFSTTRMVSKVKPKITNEPLAKFQSLLFLPSSEERHGEGGLRTKGYFKKDIEGKPLITIVTVVFNGIDYLEKTIQSVISQTYENVEYIVIDGGSTDGTLDIIKKYESQIDYWVSEKDKGIYDAMNKGVVLSHGTWINFMNAGDVFFDFEVISKVMSLSLVNEHDFIYSDSQMSNGKKFVCDIFQNRIIHQSLIYQKKVHADLGLYMVGKQVTISDYLFFIMAKDFNWLKINNVISRFELGGVSGDISHYKQKLGVDLVFNNYGRIRIGVILLVHPIYNKLKASVVRLVGRL